MEKYKLSWWIKAPLFALLGPIGLAIVIVYEDQGRKELERKDEKTT